MSNNTPSDKFQAAAAAAKAKFKAAASSSINPQLTQEAVSVMSGLEEFSNLGRTATAVQDSIQDSLIVESLLGSYLYSNSYWNVGSSTKSVSGTLVMGVPYVISITNGFARWEQGPTSEYGAAVAQGTGDIKTLFTKDGDAFPFIKPDFASVGFINAQGTTHSTGLIKKPFSPANKVAGASAWSVKLTERSAGDRTSEEAVVEWRELCDSILADLVQENGYGEGRHTGYLLLVGFVTEVALHAPSQAKDEKGKLKYTNQTPWLSISMPIFAAYSRPLAWSMELLTNSPSLKSFVSHKGQLPTAKLTAVEKQLVETRVSSSSLKVGETKPLVKVVTNSTNEEAPKAPVAGVPTSWFELPTLVKLATADSYNVGKYIEVARLVNAGTAGLEALAAYGFKPSDVAKDVANRSDLQQRVEAYKNHPLRYFKALIKERELTSKIKEADQVAAATTQPTEGARPNRLAKLAAKAEAPVVEQSTAPTVEPVPTVSNTKSAIKEMMAKKRAAAEGKVGKALAPTEAPRAKAIDEYAPPKVEESNIELDSLLGELGATPSLVAPPAPATTKPSVPTSSNTEDGVEDMVDELPMGVTEDASLDFFM